MSFPAGTPAFLLETLLNDFGKHQHENGSILTSLADFLHEHLLAQEQKRLHAPRFTAPAPSHCYSYCFLEKCQRLAWTKIQLSITWL